MALRKKQHKVTALLLSIVFVFLLLPATVFARTPIDLTEKASVEIEYPGVGAEFKLYRVADASVYGEYTLTGDFKNYPVSLEHDKEGWRALAETLSSYALRDKLEPMAKKTVDKDKKLVFTELPVGIYLVIGQRITYEGNIYTSEPFLVALPGLNGSDNWIYDVKSMPKYSSEQEKDDPVSLKVIKIWKDNKDLTKRPKSIDIELLRDGEVFDTVTLDAKNGWKHEWLELEAEYAWQIAEKSVPKGYTVAVSSDGDTITVTNTLKNPQNPQKPNLPQAGTLWWPVGILAACGMVFFLIGMIRRKNER